MITDNLSRESQPRRRTRGSLSDFPQNVTWGNYNTANSPAAVTNSGTVYYGKEEIMHDVVTPAFHRMVGDGVIVNNRMSYTSREVSGSSIGPKFQTVSGNVTYFLDYGENWMQSVLGWPSTALRAVDGYQDLLVDVETRARAGIAQPDFQGLVSLGELRETIRYLKNPFKTGLELAGAFQKKRRVYEAQLNKRLRRDGIKAKAYTEEYVLSLPGQGISSSAEIIAKRLSDLYLEFRFGLIPLVNEAEQIAAAMHANGLGPRTTSRSSNSRTETSTQDYTQTISNITYNWTDTVTRETRVRSMFLYEHYFDAGLDRWGFSPSEIPRAAWQLLPLSFIVDRFLNVGNFISALTPVGGTRVLASCTSIETTQTIKRTFGAAKFGTWTMSRQPSGLIQSVAVSKSRRPWVDPPALTIRTDNIRSMAKDTLQMLDLLTLAIQRV